MERDPNISRLIREGGIEKAPHGFTGRVMDLIALAPERKTYQPLIGRGGQIFILLLIITVVVIATVFAEPGGKYIQPGGVFENLQFKVPELHLNLDFFSEINFSGAIAAALLALFILVWSDAGLRKKKLV
ncbi:MAG: hypothetical protein R6W31_18620 [Bacteroidales bacterium]